MGKTTISNILHDSYQIYIIDCDILSRRVAEIGKPAYKKIIQTFGEEVIDRTTKEIDRKLLGKVVFANDKLRKKLVSITNFYIFIEIIKEILYCFWTKQGLVALVALLLFETKYLKYICYPIMVIYMKNEEAQIQRLIKRDDITREEAIQRIRAQWPIEKKMKMGDILINNEGKIDQLKGILAKELAPYVI